MQTKYKNRQNVMAVVFIIKQGFYF